MTKHETGFTLIEYLLVVAIAAVIVTSVAVFISLILSTQRKTQTIHEVEEQAAHIIEVITRNVQRADSITTPVLGTQDSTLELETSIPGTNPTQFAINGTALEMQESTNSPITLHDDNVSVSNLTFKNLSRYQTPGIVQVNFTLSYTTSSDRNEFNFQKDYSASAAIRMDDDASGDDQFAFEESGGQVVMETENYDSIISRSSQDWTFNTSGGGFSGAGYMTALPNNATVIDTNYATSSPQLSYYIHFTTTGTYYVWLNGYGETSADDSVHTGLDSNEIASADRISLAERNNPNWTNSTLDGPAATISVSTPGLHTFDIWMREDGANVDKIILTTDSNYTPGGNGPNESPRG